MSSPNPQIADDTSPSQNPSLVEDPQCEDQKSPHFDSQSSKTLILDDQDPEHPSQQDANNPQEIVRESENPRDSLVEGQTDTQNVDDVDASSALSPRNADINVAVADATSRRGPKRKRMGHKRNAQEKKIREKFQVLVETLKPVPFIPAKTLDFASHETLLRRLGLWDFVHIELDRSIRSDLVAQLIAGYTPSSRSSYVNGMRIMVNRADLGRALKLPVRKTVVTDDVLETLDLAESISFIEEVVSNWMLLHEDTYIMPTEVLAFIKTMKDGHLEKVDWAGLIWQMVEKELKTPQLVNCYYASHLQQLIKVQREEFLREEPKVETEAKDEEEEEEEDDDGAGDSKMGGVEDGSGDSKMGGVEDESVDLKLGGVEDGGVDLKLGGVEDGVDDSKSCRVEDGGGNSNLSGVEDGAGDSKMDGVEDGSDDTKLDGVGDGSGDMKMGGVEDGSGDRKMGGLEDGSGDVKMGGVEDGNGDVKMGGVEDGNGDVKMGGVEDGSGDSKVGGAEEGSGDSKMGGADDGSGDLRMGEVNSGRVQELEEHNIELSLGQDNFEKVEVEKEQDVGEHIVNIEEFKEKEPRQWLLDRKNNLGVMDIEDLKEEQHGQWLLDRKNNVGEPFLRQCNFSDVNSLDGESKKEEEEGQEGGEDEGEEDEEEEEEAEEDEHDGGFHLPSKCIPLEGMPSGSLMQAMEFNSGIELRDNSMGDFLSSREDAQMISGASLFNNGHKRDIGQDNNNSHHSLNGSNKRLRSDSPWNAKPVDFEMCMEQIEHWIGKARMMYASKEQSCDDLNMNQQVLLNELQKRDSMIDNLHKANMDESQKRQMEVYRLEKELYMMSNLLEGYRKALKETQKAFAEYRARCPEADEPLYKDVPASGGLVLSVMELEKERLKQEEEQRMKRLTIEKKLRDFEGGWITKLEDHLNGFQLLRNRLLTIEDQVKDLNELNAKRKVSHTPECATSEEQTA
ncbi:uncharacterized protein LOC129313574 isoform X2 [Prosopis cineraria]|uniref:uncharacterized protein LOC129313574 isoform X1 n=1 Tax=Prosopis cineraria TaxID=364024 RepID=UPI00240F1CEB|nr:uncharacterized protein LOC129313574 isoform X1 [Prosopis cineraria]XP_054812788.1 uncharacterized protein LOC129313574 isoform X2 [Prosopis cineraria]